MSIHEKGESLIRLIISEGLDLAQEFQKGVKRKADNTVKGALLASVSSSMITCGSMFALFTENELSLSFQLFEVPASYLIIAIGFSLLAYSIRLIYFTRVINVNRDQLLINFALKVANKIFEEKPSTETEEIKNLLIKVDELEKSISSLDQNDDEVIAREARSISG